LARVFISYRRSDTGAYAGAVAQRLAALQFESVFQDREDIALADNYADRIREGLGECGVVLVLMGPSWLTVRNGAGTRRLDDEADWVRREVSLALELRKPVVPVLFDGTRVPDVASLPPDLAALATTQGYDVNGSYLERDLDDLARRLERDLVAAHAATVAPRTASSPDFVRQLQYIWMALGGLTLLLAVVPYFAPALPRLFWVFPATMTVAALFWWLYWAGESMRPARPRFT
jgi:hypothetical protein